MSHTSNQQLGFSNHKKGDKLSFEHIHVKQSTFRGGLTAPIHNWFRLTPSFGPELVDIILDEMETDSKQTILDPFSGAGTTLYQAKFHQLKSYGFEINPFLYFVCKTSLNLDLVHSTLLDYFMRIEESFHQQLAKNQAKDVEDLGIPLPAIHNVFRWWRRDVLKDLLLLREVLKTVVTDVAYRHFFYLGLAGVLVPDLTNVTLGRLQLHFVDKSSEDLNVWRSFSQHIQRMLLDIQNLDPGIAKTKSVVIHTDSTEIDHIELPEKIDRVITSPPYPNRYSYVWNTRPYLYFFELFSTSTEAADLDKKTIGGTWGSATSMLQEGIVPPLYPIIEDRVSPIVEQIREQDNLMANYVTKYFNLLAKQILAQEKVVSKDVKCAYVVGNSRIKGVYVETDQLLADIFEGLQVGYKAHGIKRFRRRNSGKDLFESIVYAYK